MDTFVEHNLYKVYSFINMEHDSCTPTLFIPSRTDSDLDSSLTTQSQKAFGINRRCTDILYACACLYACCTPGWLSLVTLCCEKQTTCLLRRSIPTGHFLLHGRFRTDEEAKEKNEEAKNEKELLKALPLVWMSRIAQCKDVPASKAFNELATAR